MARKGRKMEKPDMVAEALDIPKEVLDKLVSRVKTQEDLSGPNGIMRMLYKTIVERALGAELDNHLGFDKNNPAGKGSGNSRNGKGKKTLKSDLGEIPIATPRDRKGTFEPLLVPKRERRVKVMDDAILTLYARGMTTRDIESTIRELYGVEVSHTLISEVTEAVTDEVRQWQSRPLDEVYPLVWLDGITIKVHKDKQVVQKSAFLALAVNTEGIKELLGIWIAENEGSKFWAQIMAELKNRGMKDAFIFCVDGLTGFPQAIEAVFPKAEVQLCMVHMVRNSLKYVAAKDMKPVASDLKAVYTAPSLEEADTLMKEFAEKWDSKYRAISKSWRAKWENVIPIFGYPPEIRKVMYTTNAIESMNMVIRKAIRNRRIFPSDESAIKLIYLAIRNASQKWTLPIRDWKPALNFFLLKFGERLGAQQ
jgi:putative transposase